MSSNGQNGAHAPEHEQRHHKPKTSIAIKNFSPIWFIVSMDTGILSILLSLLPYRFSGEGILSTIMFVWNLVLFCTFTLLSILRLLKYPRHVARESINTPEELSYLGAPIIAYLTLVAQVSLTCSSAWGHSMTIFAYVLWWIGLVWSMLLCSASVIVLSKRQISSDRSIPPATFLPLIAVMTQATTGGILVNYSYHISARLAVPVIVVSFLCLGYALFLSMLYYAIFLHHLIAVGPPTPAKLPTLMITVGPLGQAATAIQLLGTAAYTKNEFGEYAQGTFLSGSAASSVSAIATMLALLIVGFAVLWVMVSWYILGEALVKRQLPFTLYWWSIIFPMGVFTTALINLSIAMNSPAFRGLSAALLILMFIIYLFNLFASMYRIFTGEALMIPQKREEENKQAEAERRRAEKEQNGHSV